MPHTSAAPRFFMQESVVFSSMFTVYENRINRIIALTEICAYIRQPLEAVQSRVCKAFVTGGRSRDTHLMLAEQRRVNRVNRARSSERAGSPSDPSVRSSLLLRLFLFYFRF